jgi:hypothetical protein
MNTEIKPLDHDNLILFIALKENIIDTQLLAMVDFNRDFFQPTAIFLSLTPYEIHACTHTQTLTHTDTQSQLSYLNQLKKVTTHHCLCESSFDVIRQPDVRSVSKKTVGAA